MRKHVLAMGLGAVGCALAGLLLGSLPWPHSLPSVSRPLCRSLKESSLPLSSPALDAARASMPSAMFHLSLDVPDVAREGTGAQQPFPREDGAYPSLLKELLAETPRPLVFSGPSEAGSGLAHGLP